MLLIVIRKSDRDQDKDRYYVHKNDTECRKSHKSDVESSVYERLNVLDECVDMISFFLIKLQFILALDIVYPCKYEYEDHEECNDRIKEDKERVISLDYGILHCYRIESG